MDKSPITLQWERCILLLLAQFSTKLPEMSHERLYAAADWFIHTAHHVLHVGNSQSQSVVYIAAV